ncbi:MAG: pilus assembly protein PilM [Vibrio sp.]
MRPIFVTGIEIGEHDIKAVSVRADGESWDCISCNLIETTESLISGDIQENRSELVKVFKKLKKKLPKKYHQVSTFISDKFVIRKQVVIENNPDVHEPTFAIEQAFAQQSPIAITELYLDYVEIPVTPDSSFPESQRHFQVYATHKHLAQIHAEVIRQSGLRLAVIDVQSHALARIWQFLSHDRNTSQHWLLLDVRSWQISLCVCSSLHPIYYKEISYSDSTAPLSRTSLSGISASPPNVQFFIQRIEQQINLYLSLGYPPIQGIWLTGDKNILDRDFVAQFSEIMSIQVEHVDPVYQLISESKHSHNHLVQSSQFTFALGAALCGVHWLRGQYDR